MPLPLPMMIPFMAAQSAALAISFGENFQYGKRRISAMSNEEFNKLTPLSLSLRAQQEMSSIIPTLLASMKEYNQTMTPEILQMFGQMVKQLQQEVASTLTTAGENITDAAAHLIGQHTHPDDGIPVVDTSIGNLPTDITSVTEQDPGSTQTGSGTGTTPIPIPITEQTAEQKNETKRIQFTYTYEKRDGQTVTNIFDLTATYHNHKITIINLNQSLENVISIGGYTKQVLAFLSAYRIAFKSTYGDWV